MGVGTRWVIAAESDVPAIVAEEGEHPELWLDGIGELELVSLAGLLDVEYAPSLVLEAGDDVALRLPPPFLHALAALTEEDVASVAEEWREADENLGDSEAHEIEELLGEMAGFARDASAGPGAIGFPMS